MTPLQKIYWLRVALGIVAAIICIGYGLATGTISKIPSEFKITTLLNGMSLALITYILSYYGVIKPKFTLAVEKPQKLFTMGIGIYFIAWLVCWVLLYTIIAVA
jgi:hypothetical protein